MPAGKESPAAGGSPASRLLRPVPASPRPRRPRSAPRAARSPRSHGDVVEDEPGRGQGAQLLLLAILLLLHGAVAAAVLLAGRHGSPAGSAARTAGRRGSLRGGAGAALTAGPSAVSHPICLPRGPLPPPAAHMALRAPPSAPRVSPGHQEPAGAGEPPAAGTSCWDGTWPCCWPSGSGHSPPQKQWQKRAQFLETQKYVSEIEHPGVWPETDWWEYAQAPISEGQRTTCQGDLESLVGLHKYHPQYMRNTKDHVWEGEISSKGLKSTQVADWRMRFECACYLVNVCSLCKCTGNLSQHREHCWDWLWKGDSLSLS